jgi:hypothetical protein
MKTEVKAELYEKLITAYQIFTKWVLRHTPEIKESQRGKDCLQYIDEIEAQIRLSESSQSAPEEPRDFKICSCDHPVINEKDHCEKCGYYDRALTSEPKPDTSQVEYISNNKMKMINDIPRRNRLDLCTPAEIAIFQAMQEVEKIGADVKLTKAVTLLAEAKECVADFVDNTNEHNYDGINDIHYWKCPECNSIFATSKQTPEWVARKMAIVHTNNIYNIPCRAEYIEITKEEFFEINRKLK